jgi:hypothetical protein
MSREEPRLPRPRPVEPTLFLSRNVSRGETRLSRVAVKRRRLDGNAGFSAAPSVSRNRAEVESCRVSLDDSSSTIPRRRRGRRLLPVSGNCPRFIYRSIGRFTRETVGPRRDGGSDRGRRRDFMRA